VSDTRAPTLEHLHKGEPEKGIATIATSVAAAPHGGFHAAQQTL
jgi:hypothetical protein